MSYFFAYLGAGAAFLLLDFLWLGLIAKKFYARQMGALMAERFNIPAAAAFYVLYLIGVLVFAIAPALADGGLASAAARGGMFGFFCYATYDLTALAVIGGYKAKLALVDLVWGAVLTSAAASAGYLAGAAAGLP